MSNAATAIRARLLENTGIVESVGDRIYVAELPQHEAADMPRPAIVIRLTGGIVQSHYLPHLPQRIDVIAYGATFGEAAELDDAIARDLHQLDGGSYDGIGVRGVGVGGSYTARDPTFGWPYQWRTYDVHAINMSQ